MRIALVNNHFTALNGADLVAYSLFCKLKENGFDVVYFAGKKEPYFEKDYQYIPFFGEAKPYGDMCYIERGLKAFDIFYNKVNYTKFQLFLDETKPDIVHFHSINRYLTASVLKAAYERELPTVVSLHDSFLACPAGTLLLAEKRFCKDALCSTQSPLACVQNRCMRGSLAKSLYMAGEFQLRQWHRLYYQADAYITPSKALKALMQKTPLPDERVHVITNPLDSRYEAIQPHFQGGSFLLYVGRLVREKGLHYLLEAMRAFPDLELRVIGDGPCRQEYEALKQDYNLNKVYFYGNLPPAELHQHYANCLALVHPCNWFEAFGLTVIEGQAHGKAVIASNIGAVSELIDDKISGLLVEPGNPEAIKEAIAYLLQYPEESIRIGRQAREALLAKQLSKQFLAKTTALYAQVIEGKRAKAT